VIRTSRQEREEGTILLLTLGMVVVVLMVLTGVTQAARVFLAQRSLAGVCDSAAIAAVQGLDVDAVYRGQRIVLSEDRVVRALQRWQHGGDAAADAPGVRVALEVVSEASARVGCRRELHLMGAGLLQLGDVTLRAHATAQIHAEPRG
jgi:hypothetical protein